MNEQIKRIVGKRENTESVLNDLGVNLKKGLLFNEEMMKIRKSFGFDNGIVKLTGKQRVFCYKTHEEADKHIEELMINYAAEQIVKNER